MEKAEEELKGVQAMYRSLALALLRDRSDLPDLFTALPPSPEPSADLPMDGHTHT